MIEKLRNNELDFVVMQYPIFTNEYKFKEEIICNLNTCFYSTKKYYDLYKNDKSSLKSIPFILPLRGFPNINRLEETLKNNNIAINHKITSHTTELSKELVKQEIGIGWCIKNCIQKELNNKTLYEIDMDFKTPMATFSIAYDNEFLSNTVREFIELFKLRVKDISIENKK